jgi:hypothetical protein
LRSTLTVDIHTWELQLPSHQDGGRCSEFKDLTSWMKRNGPCLS